MTEMRTRSYVQSRRLCGRTGNHNPPGRARSVPVEGAGTNRFEKLAYMRPRRPSSRAMRAAAMSTPSMPARRLTLVSR